MIATPPDLPLDDHFILLIYPFRGRPGSACGGSRWQPALESLSRADILAAIDDSFAFLPPLRSALLPELHELTKLAIACGKPLDDFTSSMVTAAGASAAKTYEAGQSCVRFRLRKEVLDVVRPVAVTAFDAEEVGRDYAVKCQAVDAFFFPPRTGFLVIRIVVGGLSAFEAGRLHRSLAKVFYRRRLRVRPAHLRLTDGQVTHWDRWSRDLLGDFAWHDDAHFQQVIGSSFRVFS
jgi:hypothetical protein